jgi:microcystin-dependent protein
MQPVVNAATTAAALVALGIGGITAEPPGALKAFAGSSAPTGYLLCYGQAISRATYAALFTAISTAYGVGDGVTTFNVPDLRGTAIAGLDNMGGVAANRLTSTTITGGANTLGNSGGSQSHTLTASESAVLSYTSSVTDPGHVHNINGAGSPGSLNSAVSGGGSSGGLTMTSASATTGITVGTTSNAGGAAHVNVQPTMVMNWIIKT